MEEDTTEEKVMEDKIKELIEGIVKKAEVKVWKLKYIN